MMHRNYQMCLILGQSLNNIDEWLTEFQPNKVIEAKTKKGRTLELSSILTNIDNNNKVYYSKLTEEQKKEISPWVLMRYASSAKDYPEAHLITVNLTVNKNFSMLYKHPELQWKLLCSCSTGRNNHTWISPPKKQKKNKIEEALLKIRPLLKDDDLKLIQSMNKKEDLRQYFLDNGMSDAELSEIFENVV